MLKPGGTHASMLTLENPDQIVSIAPAEGQKPLFIMSDPEFELMCNPDKFYYIMVVVVSAKIGQEN